MLVAIPALPGMVKEAMEEKRKEKEAVEEERRAWEEEKKAREEEKVRKKEQKAKRKHVSQYREVKEEGGEEVVEREVKAYELPKNAGRLLSPFLTSLPSRTNVDRSGFGGLG